MKNRLRAAGDFISDYPLIDFVAAIVLVTTHAALVDKWGHGDVLSWATDTQRAALYQAGAGVATLTGGLSAIALAIYQASAGPRAAAVRKQYGAVLRRNWRSLLIGTGVSGALCLVALALDRPNDPLSSRFLFEVAVGLAAFRFARMVWLFDALLSVDDKDQQDTGRPPAPTFDPDWAAHRRTG